MQRMLRLFGALALCFAISAAALADSTPGALGVATTTLTGGKLPFDQGPGTDTALGFNTSTFDVSAGALILKAGGAAAPVFFIGPQTAGSANTYTQAATTPTGFALTDGYVVRTRINATNTAASTINVNSTGAVAIKTNTASGLAALTGGELITNLTYDFTYNSGASAFVVSNTAMGAVVAGTTQTITAAQWASFTIFDVTTAAQTLTLPVSTGLTANGGVVVKADTQAVTVTSTSPDTINGGSAGGSVTVPSGVMAVVTSNGAGLVYANLGQTVPTAANPSATASDVAVNGSAATYMRSDGAPAIQKASSSVFGLAKVDGSTITATGGVISTASSAGGGIFQYSDNGLTLTAGTRYVPIGGSGVPSTTEADYATKSPSATTAVNLDVNLSADPGAGQTLVVTLRKAGADTALTCTVTGGSGSSCQDHNAGHSVAVAQNDLIGWKIVTTGTFVATPSVTILANSGTTNNGVTGSGTSGKIAKFTGSASVGDATAADLPTTTLGTGTSVSLAAPRQYYECTGTCTVTPPTPAAGYEFCVRNANNVATVITLAAIASTLYEKTNFTAYGTANTAATSGGAAGDKICIVGKDATHYDVFSFNGTWTMN